MQLNLPTLPRLSLTSVVDIFVVAVLVYQAILIIRGRRAVHIMTGVGILVLVYLVADWLQLMLLRTLLATLAPYSAFALIVVFQSDIRRVLAGLGRRNWFFLSSRLQRRDLVEEIHLALLQLSQEKTGAIIVVEREIGLRTFVESGVLLDAIVSRDLLLSIFRKEVVLHDGAVIIQGDRIAAAACFLPLTMDPVLRGLGTRHRAAIGVTEETDCVAFVVSEETGKISVAAKGSIRTIKPEEVQEQLSEAFGLISSERKARRAAKRPVRAEGS
ncbi:MAG: diadenylate cyclase CdaA [Bryobacteraceae bacterium]|nr:diadenylate cyclase CdaA [Bryobacteraceae bacterium]MDW8377381.1 diadenylate cyclase CdaA [Bryobacterales bacterium]